MTEHIELPGCLGVRAHNVALKTDAVHEVPDGGLRAGEVGVGFVVGAAHHLDPALGEESQQIGAIALDASQRAETVPESVRRSVIAHRLPSHDWPQRILRVTGIDIATGELVVFDNESGVDLVDAVAASCAVPAAWPPVTIGDRLFMDGGVGSAVNMSAVIDCSVAVAFVPSAADTPSPWGTPAAEEIDAFPGATLAVFADSGSLAAFGPNSLDPACRLPSAEAGRSQGRREAGRVASFLGL